MIKQKLISRLISQGYSYADVGKRLGLSRQRIHQLFKGYRTKRKNKYQHLDDFIRIEIMKRDKKSKDGRIYCVLPKKIGEVKQENGQVAFPVDVSLLGR